MRFFICAIGILTITRMHGQFFSILSCDGYLAINRAFWLFPAVIALNGGIGLSSLISMMNVFFYLVMHRFNLH